MAIKILRWNNAVLCAALCPPGTEDQFPTISTSTDGIAVENVVTEFRPKQVETNESTGSLDMGDEITGGMQVTITFDAYLKGSGVPGVPWELDVPLQACGRAPVITKTDITGTTFAITGNNTLTDTGNGLANATVGTVVWLQTPSNKGRELLVSASSAASLTFTNLDGTPPALVNEAAGGATLLRYGVAAVAATTGTVSSFTAQAPWSATDQLYQGAPVFLSGNPAGGAWSFIHDYVGRLAKLVNKFASALSASTKASIPAHCRYVPATNNIPKAGIAFNVDGREWQFTGLTGTVTDTWTTGDACKAQFKLDGMFVQDLDKPLVRPALDATRPGTWRNSAFLIDGVACAVKQVTVTGGEQTDFPDDPNQIEGFGPPDIMRRKVNFTARPFLTLKADGDNFSAARKGDEKVFHMRLTGGNAAAPGQRVAETIPRGAVLGWKPANENGRAIEELTGRCRGLDCGTILATY